MSRDEELWGVAIALLARFGDDTARHAAERLGAAAVLADETGITLWREIAARISQLMCGQAGQ
ncbi:MAG: hypothetical protein EOP62_11615 [Sphingomonadales bacterium]|nr:MAG: hypothetical protein EOP62_11615 [Sphingomonadales bacterium]